MKTKVFSVKTLVLAVSLVLSGTIWAESPKAGSCMSKAVSLKSSQEVTLVNEYDSEFKEFWDYGAMYYKVTLTKGRSYTIYTSGGEGVELSVDVDWEDESSPWAMFDYGQYDDGATKVGWMYADAWDEEDPSKGTYYVYLSGEIGTKCMLYFQEGIRSFTPEGADTNPVRINITETEQNTGTRTFVTTDDQAVSGYNFIAYLEQGRKYTFRTKGGSNEESLDIDFDVNLPLPETDVTFTNSPGNVKYFLYPETSGDYSIKVYSPSNTLTTTKTCKLYYQVMPSRTPKQHRGNNEAWKPYELNEENEYSLDLVPGRLIADPAYYDAVIDESLLRISLKAGERWVFDTVGASNDLMRVYDSAGTVLSENDYVGLGSFENRTTVQASEDGWYYIGLCNSDLAYYDQQPTLPVVALSARNVNEDWAPEERDEYDPDDDVADGATRLIPIPGTDFTDKVIAQRDGSHILSAADWYDWFCIPCVTGITYRIQAVFDTDQVTDLGLSAKMYRLVNGKLVKFSDFDGSVTPGVKDPLTFTAPANGMYYIRLRVEEGLGLDFPSYTMRVICQTDDGTPMGLVTVNLMGLDTTWYFKTDAAGLYPNGATVAMPVGETFKIRFSDSEPQTYAVPGQVSTNVTALTGVDDIVTVTGWYRDVCDPADDTSAGQVTISPVAEETVAKRTFWADDPADWFKFKAKPGLYYNFELVDTSSEVVGDAQFEIVSALDGAEPVVCNAVEYLKKSFAVPEGQTKQTYSLIVTHGSETAVDSTYELRYSCANVGVLSFSQTQYNVLDDQPYVTLTVNRSASEGAVRVNYATVAGAAKPGVNYYPAEGILAWADGDMEPKTITVRLIPDVEPTWEEARRFEVRLWSMTEDCLEEDEYLATFAEGGDVATVKIKESAAQDPGVVKVIDTETTYVIDDDTNITVKVARLNSADGKIAVTAKTQNGEALSGEDFVYFKQTHTWEEGDTNVWTFTIALTEPMDSVKRKSFKVKLSAALPDETYLSPSIPTTKTTFTIVNGKIGTSLADLAPIATEYGVALSGSGSNWYTDLTGDYVCDPVAEGANAKAKFTVTGPGFFICKPSIGGSGVGKVNCSANDGVTTTSYALDLGSRNTLVVPAGTQTITFKLKNTDGDSYLTFSEIANAMPFKWVAVSDFAPAAPLDKSVVEVTDKLSWIAPDGLEKADNIWMRVYIGNKKAKFLQTTTELTNATQETTCDLPRQYADKGSNCFWRIECAYMTNPEEEAGNATWVQCPEIWSFSVAKDETPRTAIGTDGDNPWLDVNGDAIVAGKTIELVEGVYQKFTLAAKDGATGLTLVDGELPPGLTIKSSKCRVYGTPNEAGDYEALLQVWNGETAGTTMLVRFHVAEMGTAAGSFYATLVEDGSQLTNAYPKVGRISSLTVAKDGTIKAKVKLAGRTYTFTATGFDEINDRDDEALGQKMTYGVTMENVTVINDVTYTNVLALAIRSGEADNQTALVQAPGTAKLTLNVPSEDGLTVQENIRYIGELVRNTPELDRNDVSMSDFAGYYTVSLVPFGVGPAMGVPCGNGYLTLTVAESGDVTGAGLLADGTAISFSAKSQIVEIDPVAPTYALNIPVCSYASPWSFGGLLRISNGVIDSLSTLAWNKDGKSSSYDRLGFGLEIHPTGGWYNTTANLQAYYLDRDFTVEAESVEGIPAEMLPADYDYTTETMPHDVEMILEGNAPRVASRNLVASAVNPELYDLAASINPWKVKVSFVRETGLVTGTFKAWSDGETQSQFATLNHYGVLLMNRDAVSPLDTGVWTAGFYLMPVNSKWTFSLPFNIREVKVDRDWNEKVIPETAPVE